MTQAEKAVFTRAEGAVKAVRGPGLLKAGDRGQCVFSRKRPLSFRRHRSESSRSHWTYQLITAQRRPRPILSISIFFKHTRFVNV